jgi:branched-chain amino acid transport system substrate-binding protein
MTRTRSGVAALACATIALGLAACGSSSSSSGTSSTSQAAASQSSATTGGSASTAVSQATIAAALKFTGGKGGKANPSLPPVTIGYVNQEGGTPAFPEYHGVTTAAVNFVNNYLGGVDGHPLKLSACIMQSEEDGQKCGAQFRADPSIHMGILGLAVVGNQSFYKTVNGTFPVVVDVAATGPDATSPMVWNLDGGGAGVLNAEAFAAKATGAKTVALLTTDNPAGKNTALTVQTPRMKQLGMTPKVVLFPDTATTPDFATSLTNAGAAQTGAIVFNPSSAAQCNELYDAIHQLGIKTPVVTNVFCAADSVVKHLGSGMSGWEFASFGWNPRVSGDPQSDAYVNVLAAAGHPELTNAGYTFKSFADVLALTKLANQVGYAKLSGQTMNQAILAWRGPGYMLSGALHCGANKATVSVCGNTGRNSAFKNNAWVDQGPVTLPGA